jgi:uncharacterized lipoprotein YddW (UPF0748 family)
MAAARSLLLALPVLAACAGLPDAPAGLDRAIWVTRHDWRTAADVERVVHDCADAGFAAVLFQVRGNGTVLFDSRFEPWSEQFGFRHPGFDPLATAVAAAHARGLQLHAWVNAIPGWRGNAPPADPRQLWNARPDWFLADRHGQRQALARGGYLCLNPCLPEVREHLVALCRELATRYRVDGIHLDYIRFVDRDQKGGAVYPTNARSVALCRRETGKDALLEPAALERWKTECVTRLVAAIRSELRRTRPELPLTAAVIADPARALADSNQDWPRWAEQRLVDALLPMNYSADDAEFRARAGREVDAGGAVAVIVGVGAYRHEDPAQTVRQLDAAHAAGASGTAVFAYASVFGNDRRAHRDALRAWNRRGR